MGTPWITQLGFKEEETAKLADIIADTLQAIIPCCWQGMEQEELRGKVDFNVLEESKLRVIDLCEEVGIEPEPSLSGYPHFFSTHEPSSKNGKWAAFDIGGERVRPFLNYTLTSDIEELTPGKSQATRLITPRGAINGSLTCDSSAKYRLSVPAEEAALSGAWLRALSDGYVRIDDDTRRKCIGPVWIQESSAAAEPAVDGDPIGQGKPLYLGIGKGSGETLPDFTWDEPDVVEPKRTALNETHREMGAKMVTFAGWDMPVWYTSVHDEHVAVRNDARRLWVGNSLYTQFLDPDGNVIDDLLVYRRGQEVFLLVVNAANAEKDWAWLNAVREGHVRVDNDRPWAMTYGRGCTLRDMRDPKQGDEMLLDLALQGPKSRDILLALGCDEKTATRLKALPWTGLIDGIFGGFDLIVSCTGYTGERVAYELFIHPEKSAALWKMLLEVGAPFGLKPAGLGARDSLRTEAGLPLHGQEMAGELGLGVGDAGFAAYVKTYKPWFIGRSGFLNQESTRKSEVTRFRFNDKGVRMAHYGDPVVDRRGRVIGVVTSCAVDRDGYLLGQAYLKRELTTEGTPIAIFQGASKKIGIAPAELSIGDQVAIPSPATVLSRFPLRD
jgi:glycine hydroxymethyltransferase